jgi:hypothetical protein
MTIVLFAIGLLATAAGFITIGFGIPINAFSLGNTLIITGTLAVAAGLILIALALVLGQLRRIAEALNQPRAGRPAESTEVAAPRVVMSAAPSVAAVAPAPPLPEFEPHPAEPPRAPEPRVAEPPFAPPPSEPAPLDWLRARTKPATAASPAAERPMVEVPDEAPLSPRPPQYPVTPPAAEPASEPKVWSPARDSAPPQGGSAPRIEQPMPRATPQVESPKEKDRFGFDQVWPDRTGGAAPAAEPAKREPALDMPLPPVPARPRESRATAEKRAEPAPRKPLPERGPAILKSGVIDGMPYTLYADGSIEAQLPQGTVKFASVDALRAHLEKQT